MRCEVVAIGTELLLGQIVDTNSAWIGQQLAESGIDSHFQTKVGDNLDRMVAALTAALARSDAVICCGGLGPTQDDITREAIARVMQVDLVRDESIVDVIRGLFANRGWAMPDNNLSQADVPVGARIIPQTRGTAPGLICPVGDKVIYAVPGVPHEMRDMLDRAILADLRQRSGAPSTIRSRTLRTWGLGESALAERIAGRVEELDEVGNPTIAFLASGMEGIKVRVTVKSASVAEATSALDDEEQTLRRLLGDKVFGIDDETMETTIGSLLSSRGLTLGLAESLTGGMVASRLCDGAGASGWFRGSIVAYSSDVKSTLLGVDEGPVVSESAARQMAVGAASTLGSDVGLAITGVAGPAEQDGEPVGSIWMALSLGDSVEARHVQLAGDRRHIREIATITLLDMLRLRLIDPQPA